MIRPVNAGTFPAGIGVGLLFLLFSWNAYCVAPPRITEFLADNDSGLVDDDLEPQDWIEIHNPGAVSVSLEGWSLTDSAEDLSLWTFPDVRLAPGDYLIVFASGKDRRSPVSPLHANFRLDRDGEYLALIHPDGTTIASAFDRDEGRFPPQRTDISYGISVTTGVPAYFTEPTPGSANGAGLEGFVEDTRFSVDRGFFEEPFDLEIASDTEGASIYYTTDGSPPMSGSGLLYEQPIRVERTTVVRAAAFRENWLPTNVDSQTYLFPQDIIHQPHRPPGWPTTWHEQAADYEMDPQILLDRRYGIVIKEALRSHPVIALSMRIEDLFDADTGIYANASRKGDAWERPVSVELFNFPHGEDAQVDAGLRMQGNASRASSRPKHNMRLAFRREYGPGSLEFPLFENSDVTRFNNLVLRGQNGDSWIHPNANQRERAQYIRDQWHRDAQAAMGHDTLKQGHFHLYINGLYWGFYHVFDRAEAEFMAEHFGGGEEDYDVVQDFNKQAGQVEAIDGDLEAWDAMIRLGETRPESLDTFQSIQQYLNLDNFVDYLLLNFYSGNTDWDNGNWRAGRRREPGAGYIFFAWDSERTIGDSAQSSLATGTDVTNRNVANRATGLHQNLTRNAEYRLYFADRIRRHFYPGGALSPSIASELWMKRVEEIRLPLIAEAARWGDAHRPDDPYSPADEWQEEAGRLIQDYFPVRTGVVFNQLRNRNLYPGVPAVAFDPPGGSIAIGTGVRFFTETLDGNKGPRVAGEFVYTLNGDDPRMPGGEVHPQAKVEDSVLLLESTTLKARLLIDGEWGALTEADYTMEAAGAFELAQARASGDPRGILVYFTRPPEPSDALNPAHYQLLGQSAAVLEAELLNLQTVLLRVDEFDMTPMTLEVRNIRESGADPGSATSVFQAGVRLKPVESFDYGPLSWVQQPRSLTVFEGTDARFSVMAEGSTEEAIQYRWMRDGVLLDGETEAAHELKGVRAEDSGSHWQAAAFNDNGAFQPILSDEARLIVIADRFGPAADAIEGWSVLNRVDIRFNEAIDPATVAAASNYILDGVPVHQAVWDAKREIVSLFTGPLESGMRYSLSIAGVEDLFGNGSDRNRTVEFMAVSPSYPELVLLDVPVRYWRFGEPEGASTVSSLASGIDSLSAGDSSLVNPPFERANSLLAGDDADGALALDSTRQQSLAIPNGSDLNVNEGPWTEKSLEVWLKPGRLPRLGETAIVYEQGAGTRGLALYLFGTQNALNPTAADLYWFAFNNSAGDGPGAAWGPAFGNAVFNRAAVQAGETYHVVGVMDGDDSDELNGILSLYLNGVLAGQQSGAGQIYNHSGDIRAGYGDVRLHNNATGGFDYFDGVLDELALYNHPLTPDRIRAHYLAGAQTEGGSPGLIAPYLQIGFAGADILIHFTGRLESSAALNGSWAPFSAQSPVVLPMEDPISGRFWRAARE